MIKSSEIIRIGSILSVDHIGYAVKEMASAREQFMALGFTFKDEKVDELRNVNVSVGENQGIRIELLSPVKGERSPIDGYLQKIGSTPYHICYRVDNMDTAIEELRYQGFTLMGYPDCSVPLGGKVCFLYSSELGIVELIDYEK